jgi:hypothetical protein
VRLIPIGHDSLPEALFGLLDEEIITTLSDAPLLVSTDTEKEAPIPEKVSPAPDTEAPAPEKVSPTPETEAPTPEADSPGAEAVPPVAETVSPGAENAPPEPEAQATERNARFFVDFRHSYQALPPDSRSRDAQRADGMKGS